MPMTIDPITDEVIFTVDTNEVSLAELIQRPDIAKVSEKKTFQFPDFCILNNDDTYTKNLLLKLQFRNWKGFPIPPKKTMAFTGKDPRHIRLKAETGEIEIRLLFS
ncbi:MAG: hypothetical protein LBG52_01605 [Candidatus Peribacteria bacterium]|jgi:hypothetical protein|nr:hypothetical protein [Candidatus Peribacteria bacterium]